MLRPFALALFAASIPAACAGSSTPPTADRSPAEAAAPEAVASHEMPPEPPTDTAPQPLHPQQHERHFQLSDGSHVSVDANDRVRVVGRDGRLRSDSSCGANGFGYDDSVAWMRQLQEHVRLDQRAQLAATVGYPLRVNLVGEDAREYRNPQTLVRFFDEVFTPEVRRNILAAEPRDPGCSWRGVMFGSGVVWAQLQDGQLRLDTINHGIPPAR